MNVRIFAALAVGLLLPLGVPAAAQAGPMPPDRLRICEVKLTPNGKMHVIWGHCTVWPGNNRR